MVTRRSVLRGLLFLLPALSGCSLNDEPTRICKIGLYNWDRERHHIQVEIVADDTTLWEREETVSGRTDDAIPGSKYEEALPDKHAVYTVRARVDGSEWLTKTIGDEHSGFKINVHAEEGGEPGIWMSADCPPETTTAFEG